MPKRKLSLGDPQPTPQAAASGTVDAGSINKNASYLEALAGWEAIADVRASKAHTRALEMMDRFDTYYDRMKADG